MWVEAAVYYADNIDSLKDILNQFDEEEAKVIEESKKLVRSQTLRADLTFIKANLAFLPHYTSPSSRRRACS